VVGGVTVSPAHRGDDDVEIIDRFGKDSANLFAINRPGNPTLNRSDIRRLQTCKWFNGHILQTCIGWYSHGRSDM
jgi:hypothetical protein